MSKSIPNTLKCRISNSNQSFEDIFHTLILDGDKWISCLYFWHSSTVLNYFHNPGLLRLRLFLSLQIIKYINITWTSPLQLRYLIQILCINMSNNAQIMSRCIIGIWFRSICRYEFIKIYITGAWFLLYILFLILFLLFFSPMNIKYIVPTNIIFLLFRYRFQKK